MTHHDKIDKFQISILFPNAPPAAEDR